MDYERSAGGILVPNNELVLGGRFIVDHIRGGEKIDEFEFDNLVVDQGLNHILDVTLHGATQVGAWYIGVFEGNYTPVAGVTAATITAASTECTNYDEATRVSYDEAAAAAKSITNAASRATFTFNATKTIYGAFLVSAPAKSATTGTLLSAGRFTTAKDVEDDDQLLVTYTFNASSV